MNSANPVHWHSSYLCEGFAPDSLKEETKQNHRARSPAATHPTAADSRLDRVKANCIEPDRTFILPQVCRARAGKEKKNKH